MIEQVSTLLPVIIGDMKCLFFLITFNDYVSRVGEELEREYLALGEDLDPAVKVVKANKRAARASFREVMAKSWPEDILKRLGDEQDPFLLVIETDFAAFDPASDRWGIVWFGKFYEKPDTIYRLFGALARKVRQDGDVFEYLNALVRKDKYRKFGNSFEIEKPAVFRIAIDIQTILMDVMEKETRIFQPCINHTIEEARNDVNDIIKNFIIDTESRRHNRFFYEIYPLLLIAEHMSHQVTHVVFTGIQSRFDGLMVLRHERKKQTVELTVAIDGKNDALQMELLKKRGGAPAFVKIEATGTKRNRIFGDNEPAGVTWPEYRDALLTLLENALARKVEKAKTNQHYSGAWLGIVFDDWIEPAIDFKKERFDPLCREVLSDNCKTYAPFSRVFFVGISGKYVFDSHQE